MNHPLRRALRLAAAAIAVCFAVPIAAQSLKPLKLTLNFLAGGPQVGFVYAKKLGYYRDVGIDLTIEEGQGSATTAQLVATGRTDVGYAEAPSAMLLRAKGAPIKVLASVFQTNAYAIISLEATGIRSPKDLVGRRVAVIPGTAQTTLLDAIFAANGIDKKTVDLYNIDTSGAIGVLLEKKVDAILAGADFQSIQIRDRGFPINEILYRDVGVPTVGHSILARDDKLAADPDLYRKFVSASLKGWDAARNNPEAAAVAMVEAFPTANKEATQKQSMVVFKLMCAPGATQIGKVPTRNWQVTFDLLTTYLNLPKDRPISDYYTDDYIPVDAARCG